MAMFRLKDSIYVLENCILFEDELYERLDDVGLTETGYRWRVAYGAEHYDYISDPGLVSTLEKVWELELR